MYRDPGETGRKNRGVMMSRGDGGGGVGTDRRGLFVDQDRFLMALLAFSSQSLGLGSWRGSGLAFLCLSAAREASVLAYTKRARRVGVGDSAKPGSGR